MMTQSQSSFKLSWKQITVSLLVIIYIVINFFQIGGDVFVINLNSFIVLPLALGVTLMALSLWRQIAVGSQNRVLWSGLTIGWALWTIAEFWWAITTLIGREIPYPSWADFFWLLGYIAMYVALWARIRSLPKMNNPVQKIATWATSLILLSLTIVFIFIPILQNSDPTATLEKIWNILYPLTDIILLILVFRIFFSYQQGMYGRAWNWLTLGFIFFAIGDLGFAYANTAGLYYPNQQVNVLSTFGVDIPYALSYLFVLIGLFTMRSIQRSYHPIENIYTPPILVPNTHLLVFTFADDTVMDVSRNYRRVFSENIVKGMTVQEVLGSSPEDTNTLFEDIKANSILKERNFLVNTHLGQESAWISGIVILNPQGEYWGVYLLLRMLTKDYSLDKLLTDHERGMVRSILGKTGAQQKQDEEIKQLLANYYRAILQGLYNLVFDEGGSIMADVFFTKLQTVSKQHEWQISFQPGTLLDVSTLSLAETRKALPILFETARQFVAEIIDTSSADRIIQDIRAKFDKSALENISYFELAE